MFVIAAGNPFDGIRLIGQPDGTLFPTADEANEYADSELHNAGFDWWVVEITALT
jgi:hypothetical protein